VRRGYGSSGFNQGDFLTDDQIYAADGKGRNGSGFEIIKVVSHFQRLADGHVSPAFGRNYAASTAISLFKASNTSFFPHKNMRILKGHHFCISLSFR
jgi:hypothetical protein